jgi:pantoate--beta-alanine ligase
MFTDKKPRASKSRRDPLLFKTVPEFRAWRGGDGGNVIFVPTMGALHEAHSSLMERARELGKRLVVSIFVNPLQFGPHEDFALYPRNLERDLEVCAKAGVDAVLYPTAEEIYPEGRETCTKVLPPPRLSDVLEGAFRPGFFTGVATVVAKLFNIVQPDMAVFGEKDYQQLLVVKQLVSDLKLPIKIVEIPIVRAQDGLALSSRNAYLSTEQREKAPLLYKALQETVKQVRSGIVSVEQALEAGRKMIVASGDFELQYLDARDKQTFVPYADAKDGFVVLVAAKLGDVRLIDNIVLRD